MDGIQKADFSQLSKDGISSAKKKEHEKDVDAKATRSVEHTVSRKEKLPPTPTELRRMERDRKEVLKENSAYFEKRKIAQIKRIATQYVEFFSEKYPAVKKLKKPGESDGKEEWDQYLGDVRAAIGSSKAGERFDGMLSFLAQGIVTLSQQFPAVFQGANLSSPANFADVVASAGFKEQIEDEKMEIIFTHERWFQSSYIERFGTALAKAAYATAMHNKQIAEEQALTPEVKAALAQRRARPRNADE